MIGPVPEGAVRCLSCGGIRTPAEMMRAIDLSWHPIPGEYVCRDSGLCFYTMAARPFETGQITPTGDRKVQVVRVQPQEQTS